MADLIAQATEWLEAQREAHMARTVVYVRGSDSADVVATVGRREYSADNGYGVIETFVMTDFLIRSDRLYLAGEPITPARGDRVRDTRGEATFVYEVAAPGDRPHYEPSDGRTLRIHAKLIETELL